VDFVGRFETLEESFQEVCRRLRVRARLPVKYASRRRSRDYRRFYSARSRALVAERYARDIEMFGYAFEAKAT
jgi:chondroitin 4-sulfotransferase 11